MRKAGTILLVAVVLGLVPLGVYLVYRNYHWKTWLFLVALLSFVAIGAGWVYRRRPKGSVFSPGDLFAAAALGWLVAGLVYERFAETTTVDVQVFDTYFVVANLYLFDGAAILFGLIAAFYYLLPGIGGLSLAAVPGHIHFWVSFTGMLLLVYASMRIWVAVALLAAQVLFVFNLVYSALKRRN